MTKQTASHAQLLELVQMLAAGNTDTDVLENRAKILLRPIPPDPDEQNPTRAKTAEMAIKHFQRDTGSPNDTAFCDLLSAMIHFCDYNGLYFHEQLNSAGEKYDAEIGK